MTNPTVSSPRKNKSRSGRKTKTTAADDLVTPDALRQAIKQPKNTQNVPDMDTIPTRDNGILGFLARKDNVAKLCTYNTIPIPTSPSKETTHRIDGTSPTNTQRWAGGSYSNSPAANLLPQPSALLFDAVPRTQAPAPTMVPRRLDFEEAPVFIQTSRPVDVSTMPAHVYNPMPYPYQLAYQAPAYIHQMPTPDLSQLSHQLKYMLNIQA